MTNAIPNAPITPTSRAKPERESPTINAITHLMFAGGGAFATSLLHAGTYPIAMLMKTDHSFFSYMSGKAAKCAALAGAGIGVYASFSGMQANREYNAARDDMVFTIKQKLMTDLQMPEADAQKNSLAFWAHFEAEAAKHPDLPPEQIAARVQTLFEQTCGQHYDAQAMEGMQTVLQRELQMSPQDAQRLAADINRRTKEALKQNPSASLDALQAQLIKEFAPRLETLHATPNPATTPDAQHLCASAHQGQVAAAAEKSVVPA